MQGLALHNPQRPHRLPGPEGEGELARRLAMLVQIGGLQALEGLAASDIGRQGGQLVGLEAEQVAAAWHVRVSDRIAARACGDKAT